MYHMIFIFKTCEFQNPQFLFFVTTDTDGAARVGLLGPGSARRMIRAARRRDIRYHEIRRTAWKPQERYTRCMRIMTRRTLDVVTSRGRGGWVGTQPIRTVQRPIRLIASAYEHHIHAIGTSVQIGTGSDATELKVNLTSE